MNSNDADALALLWAAQSKLLLCVVDAVCHLPGVDAQAFLDELHSTVDVEVEPGSPLRPSVFAFLEGLGELESAYESSAAALKKFPIDDD